MKLKKPHLLLGVFAICILSIALLLLLFVGKNNININSGLASNDSQLILFATPSVSDQVIKIARQYSSSTKTKINLNFVTEQDLGNALSEIDSPDNSIGFIGYELKKQHMDFAKSLGSQKLFGVASVQINQNNNQLSLGGVFKNLCQLEKVTRKDGFGVMLSKNSIGYKDLINDLYKSDCFALCASLKRKVVALTDTSPLNFIVQNKNDYALLSRSMIPKLLSHEGFTYIEVKGLIFYFKKEFLDEISNNTPDSFYKIIEIVNSNKLSIVIDDPMEMEDITEKISQDCQNTLVSDFLFDGNLDPKFLSRQRVILIGLQSDIEDIGVKIYEPQKSVDIWFYCQNPNDVICNKFQSFLSTKKQK
ncbi:MAG: hypothetical protein JJW01_02335 [Alphaproteobacteria bacterium]|nr:hypothetical protein [Rickettsiales bacterium]